MSFYEGRGLFLRGEYYGGLLVLLFYARYESIQMLPQDRFHSIECKP